MKLSKVFLFISVISLFVGLESCQSTPSWSGTFVYREQLKTEETSTFQSGLNMGCEFIGAITFDNGYVVTSMMGIVTRSKFTRE